MGWSATDSTANGCDSIRGALSEARNDRIAFCRGEPVAVARGRRLSLPNLLEQGMTPVLIVDDDERTSFVSEGLIQLTGWDRDTYENLRYRRGAPVGPAPRDILGCTLAPPAECWKGRFMDESAVIPHRDGRVLNLHVQFIPLLQPDHSICSIMVSARAADPAAGAV